MAMDKLLDSNSKTSHIEETVYQSQSQDDPLKLGDMVTFYDDNDKPINGIVRWIDRNKEIFKKGSKIVGIETVSFYYMHTYIMYM